MTPVRYTIQISHQSTDRHGKPRYKPLYRSDAPTLAEAQKLIDLMTPRQRPVRVVITSTQQKKG